jgi:hypothetical protein
MCVGPETYIGGMRIDYFLFYVSLKNFSLVWRRRHYRWRAAKFRLLLGAQAFEQWGIFIVPHQLWCWPRFFRSHPKDHSNQSPLTNCMGMQRTYSNPDPHGVKPETIYREEIMHWPPTSKLANFLPLSHPHPYMKITAWGLDPRRLDVGYHVILKVVL